LPVQERLNSESYAGTNSMPGRDPFGSEAPITASIDETIAATDLHATSDALNMLSHAAQLDQYATPGQRSHTTDRPHSAVSPQDHVINVPSRDDGTDFIMNNTLQYKLVSQGLLTTNQILQLIAR